jgi:hypothetical protein
VNRRTGVEELALEDNESEKTAIRDLKTEEGAEDLGDSALMRPYVRLAEQSSRTGASRKRSPSRRRFPRMVEQATSHV